MDWITPKQHLRRLRIERLIYKIKCMGIILLFISTIYVGITIIDASITSHSVVDRLNKCNQKHSFEYCNKNIK